VEEPGSERKRLEEPGSERKRFKLLKRHLTISDGEDGSCDGDALQDRDGGKGDGGGPQGRDGGKGDGGGTQCSPPERHGEPQVVGGSSQDSLSSCGHRGVGSQGGDVRVATVVAGPKAVHGKGFGFKLQDSDFRREVKSRMPTSDLQENMGTLTRSPWPATSSATGGDASQSSDGGKGDGDSPSPWPAMSSATGGDASQCIDRGKGNGDSPSPRPEMSQSSDGGEGDGDRHLAICDAPQSDDSGKGDGDRHLAICDTPLSGDGGKDVRDDCNDASQGGDGGEGDGDGGDGSREVPQKKPPAAKPAVMKRPAAASHQASGDQATKRAKGGSGSASSGGKRGKGAIEQGCVVFRQTNLFEFPEETAGWSNEDLLTWMLLQHSPGLPAVLDWFGFEILSGQVSAHGSLEHTIEMGRSMVADLPVESICGIAEEIRIVIQKRKHGNFYRLDVCCKHRADGQDKQLGSQVFEPNEEGEFNQWMWLHILMAWRCLMLSLHKGLRNSMHHEFPIHERVQRMCYQVKKYLAKVQAYGPE
jgi:hypothetical protein